jgi:Protein of unknown function (DUF3592)
MGGISMTDTTSSMELKPGWAVVIISQFFLAFLAGSAFFVLDLWQMVMPEWRANHSFTEHSCVIREKRIGEHRDDDGTTYRPEFLIAYSLDGRDHEIWTYNVTRAYSFGRASTEHILLQFVVGQRYSCWYDPNDPSQAVLVLEYSWFRYIFMLIPLAFIIIGAVGMRHFWLRLGKSRQGAIAP